MYADQIISTTDPSNPVRAYWEYRAATGVADSQNGTVGGVAQLTFTIKVTRNNTFYIFNYVLMVAILVGISFFTFVIDPASLDVRLTITLTVVLSINVFQVRLHVACHGHWDMDMDMGVDSFVPRSM